jgi:hypothetical protein
MLFPDVCTVAAQFIRFEYDLEKAAKALKSVGVVK